MIGWRKPRMASLAISLSNTNQQMGEAGRHRGKRASRGGSFFEPMVLTDATTDAADPRQAAPKRSSRPRWLPSADETFSMNHSVQTKSGGSAGG